MTPAVRRTQLADAVAVDILVFVLQCPAFLILIIVLGVIDQPLLFSIE